MIKVLQSLGVMGQVFRISLKWTFIPTYDFFSIMTVFQNIPYFYGSLQVLIFQTKEKCFSASDGIPGMFNTAWLDQIKFHCQSCLFIHWYFLH